MPRAVLVNPRRPSSSTKPLFIHVRPTSDGVRMTGYETIATDGTYRGKYSTLKEAVKKARGFARYQRKHAGRHAAVAVQTGGIFSRRYLHNPRRRRNPSTIATLQKRQRGLGVAINRRARSGKGSAAKGAALIRAYNRTGAELARRFARADRLRMERSGEIDTNRRRRKKRRRNPMTKKQRAAVRKMQAGLRRWKAKQRRRHAPKRSRSSSSRKRRNPSRSRLPARSRRAVRTALTRLVPVPVALVRTRNPKRRKDHAMAKRRRRHRRSNPPRRHRRRHHASPRRHHRRRYRHNPGVGGAVRMLTSAALPAVAGGVGAGLLDSLLLGGRSVLVRVGGKLLAAGLGGAILRRNPTRATAFVASMVGTAAYEAGIRIAGGMVAHNKPAGMKELAGMAAEDEASLGLLQEELRGVGLLEEDNSRGLGDFEPNLGDEEPNLGDEEMADMGDEYTE